MKIYSLRGFRKSKEFKLYGIFSVTVNVTEAPHTETPPVKFGLCKLGVGCCFFQILV